MIREDLKDVLPLYRELTLEQCAELYKMQRKSLTSSQKRCVLATIGARAVYGEDYQPGVHNR